VRRFGVASLSIIPHPTLMDTSESGGLTCEVTLTNNTGHDLTTDPVYPLRNFDVRDTWNPAPPHTIEAGATATWAADDDGD
jgi:hypothetical protein